MASVVDGRIGFLCQCGQKINARPELAGHKAKCPKCSELVMVPIAIAPVEPTPAEPKKPLLTNHQKHVLKSAAVDATRGTLAAIAQLAVITVVVVAAAVTFMLAATSGPTTIGLWAIFWAIVSLERSIGSKLNTLIDQTKNKP